MHTKFMLGLVILSTKAMALLLFCGWIFIASLDLLYSMGTHCGTAYIKHVANIA